MYIGIFIVLIVIVSLAGIFVWRIHRKRTFDIAQIAKLVMDDSILDTNMKKILIDKRIKLENKNIDISFVLKNVASFKLGYVEFIIHTSVAKKTCSGTFKITKITRLRDRVNNNLVIMLVKVNLEPV
jgi:hypothetical protein